VMPTVRKAEVAAVMERVKEGTSGICHPRSLVGRDGLRPGFLPDGSKNAKRSIRKTQGKSSQLPSIPRLEGRFHSARFVQIPYSITQLLYGPSRRL
jgi:hypothetical protein